MATLSKHGGELLSIHGLTSDVSYRSDGQIMRNYGSGWKLWKKVKAGVSPVEAAQRAKERTEQADRELPARAALHAWVLDNCPLSHRWKLIETVKLLADDSDGIFSAFDDDFSANGLRGRYSFEDCADLCRLYRAAMVEAQERGQVTE